MGRPLSLLVLVLSLALVATGGVEEQDGTCAADGKGCVELPVYPDCEYSCNVSECIGPNTGNRRQFWPPCPEGPHGCRNCRDQHAGCQGWARAYNGKGCEDNPGYMIDVCARSCNTCHLRDLTMRCKHLRDAPESLGPGDLNETFQRLLNIKGLDVEVISEDPWILKFPKFLSDKELKFLRHPMIVGKWSTAADRGMPDEHGKQTEVFSTNRKTDVAWCNCKCQDHPVARQLISRVSEMLRVHPHYTEAMQFLRYTPGMYYRPHHDTVLAGSLARDYPNNVAKHRVYTFFMYLTNVAEGGGTRFPDLNLTVQPERGSAILWPSVYNHDPWSVDPRLRHEAMVVKKGEKLSVNFWWYLGPRSTANEIGCAGAKTGT